MPVPEPKSILVAGDVCLDVVAVPIPKKPPSPDTENWRQTGESRTHYLPGGAMLLKHFISEAFIAEKEEWKIYGPQPVLPSGIGSDPFDPERLEDFLKIAERLRRDEIIHSLLELAQFPTTANEKDKSKTLRVAEAHGYSGPEKGDATMGFEYPSGLHPKIAVLDDTGNLFRKQGHHTLPFLGIKDSEPTQNSSLVVYKLHRPLPDKETKNSLWQTVRKRYAENCIVTVTIDDIRELGLPVSRGLSWERTTMDVIWHLLNISSLAELKSCARLIIRLGESGAIYVQNVGEAKDSEGNRLPEHCAWLIYDPAEIEGSVAAAFENRGGMVGLGSVFAAALVQRLAAAGDDGFSELLMMPKRGAIELPVLSGIRAGLLAGRRLLQLGYGNKVDSPHYPGRELFADPEKEDPSFACRRIPIILEAQQPDRGYWRLLDDIFSNHSSELHSAVELMATNDGPENPPKADATPEELKAPDPKILAAGLLAQAPIAVFAGTLRAYDRREIENYRALYALLHEYIQLREPARPLSVAVFGPPGSGKSFGVKQVARELTEHNATRPIKDLTFNLSQYKTADELAAAFHLVHDLVLEGKIPLVFFDEFDTALGGQKLGWLRYFLAPMQDGRFLDRGALHPIGQAIFVFAGGTCDTYQEFEARATPEEGQMFKDAKGPDFLSRLRGALNIPSLNFLQPQGPHAPSRPGTYNPYGPIECIPCEAAILLRRAGVLAHQLATKAPEIKSAKGSLQVNPEVLKAFLYIPEFLHGNRSLEALLDMSRFHGSCSFTPSQLPTEANTALHANPMHFSQLIGSGYPFPEAERIAIARSIHKTYLESKPENVDSLALLPWDDPRFPNHLKQSNLEQADHIAEKLRFVGLWFRKVSSDAKHTDLGRATSLLEQYLEPLAQFEHDRWAAQKRRQGWTAGSDNTEESKVTELLLHNCLFPWNELTETQQKLDYDAIRAIPKHLAFAGYEIVKL